MFIQLFVFYRSQLCKIDEHNHCAVHRCKDQTDIRGDFAVSFTLIVQTRRHHNKPDRQDQADKVTAYRKIDDQKYCNSLLAAIYSGGVAASTIAGRREPTSAHPDFSRELEQEKKNLDRQRDTRSPFPVMYVRDMLADTMQKRLGIVRDEANLSKGLEDIDYYLSIAERIRYDSSVMPYFNYSLTAILTLARATMTCALSRRESRGAHYRSDFPETDAALQAATIIAYDGGKYSVRLDEERAYEG